MTINWKRIGANLALIVAAEGTIMQFVPLKYQPYAHAILGIVGILAGLMQEQAVVRGKK